MAFRKILDDVIVQNAHRLLDNVKMFLGDNDDHSIRFDPSVGSDGALVITDEQNTTDQMVIRVGQTLADELAEGGQTPIGQGALTAQDPTNHGSNHTQAGGDGINVENLPTGLSDGFAPVSDGNGGLTGVQVDQTDRVSRTIVTDWTNLGTITPSNPVSGEPLPTSYKYVEIWLRADNNTSQTNYIRYRFNGVTSNDYVWNSLDGTNASNSQMITAAAKQDTGHIERDIIRIQRDWENRPTINRIHHGSDLPNESLTFGVMRDVGQGNLNTFGIDVYPNSMDNVEYRTVGITDI